MRRLAQQLCTNLGFRKAEINILFTTNLEIRQLHKQFMGIDTATDCMTFIDAPAKMSSADGCLRGRPHFGHSPKWGLTLGATRLRRVPGTCEKPRKHPRAHDIFAGTSLIDIVISLDRAAKQAKPRGATLFEEVALLICHCLLHAQGYDDLKRKDRLTMRQREFETLMKVL
ncbi:MAG: rRNA maturation RNase YbeY [Deltaproteobacteria bacterium]|nr:rRNA maturation RNase YbeY [Deltaproteobacteria bacterium]